MATTVPAQAPTPPSHPPIGTSRGDVASFLTEESVYAQGRTAQPATEVECSVCGDVVLVECWEDDDDNRPHTLMCDECGAADTTLAAESKYRAEARQLDAAGWAEYAHGWWRRHPTGPAFTRPGALAELRRPSVVLAPTGEGFGGFPS
jgi:hypothetical protein